MVYETKRSVHDSHSDFKCIPSLVLSGVSLDNDPLSTKLMFYILDISQRLQGNYRTVVYVRL